VTNGNLDKRWGGYWHLSPGFAFLVFQGSETDARLTLVSELEAWREALTENEKKRVSIKLEKRPKGYAAQISSSRGTDAGSIPDMDIGSRLIPFSFVSKNGGKDAKDLLTDMVVRAEVFFTAYQLGGQV
jgi:hypothetical protein